MASLNRRTWVWVGSGSWWWTGKPGVLQSMGSQRVGYNWAPELCWTDGVFSSHIWMDHREGWVLKNWCLRTVVLGKTLESPLDSKESKPVSPKEKEPWIFIEQTDAEAEVQYFGHLMWRANSLEKTLILGKIESRRRRGQQRMSWLDGITDSVDMSLSKL